MSVADINIEKLNAIRNKLAKSQGFQFSENLKSVFDLNGHRQAGNNILLRMYVYVCVCVLLTEIQLIQFG
jgi:hypothetical protein